MRRLRHLTRQLSPVRGAQATQMRASATAVDSKVLIEERGNNYLFTLNKPKALNALDHEMVLQMTPVYQKIHAAQSTQSVIVMKGAGGKGFCAGGDIVDIYKGKIERKEDTEQLTTFFKDEYILNQLIGTLPDRSPQVALLNGITMGGGVGLSVHGQYRVATDNTMFAMPETGIGFFCDVGGSYFLPRLKWPMGMYLALTGARLKGPDVLHAGVATHYVSQDKMEELEAALLALDGSSGVEAVLEKFHESSTPDKITPMMDDISRHFSKESVQAILESLNNDGSEWAQKQVKTMSRMSPMSLAVVFRQMIEGGKRDFGDCFTMELEMSKEFMRQGDFFEGVRALLVDKDNKPAWTPAKLDGVTDDAVNKYFP